MTKQEIAKELQIVFTKTSVGEDVFANMADFVLSLRQEQNEALTVKELYIRLAAAERNEKTYYLFDIYKRARELADYFNEQEGHASTGN